MGQLHCCPGDKEYRSSHGSNRSSALRQKHSKAETWVHKQIQYSNVLRWFKEIEEGFKQQVS